jgi:hypothetical protein
MVKLCSFASEVQLINKPTYTSQHGCTCENLCIRKNLVDKRPPNGNDNIECMGDEMNECHSISSCIMDGGARRRICVISELEMGLFNKE